MSCSSLTPRKHLHVLAYAFEAALAMRLRLADRKVRPGALNTLSEQ